MGDSFGGGDLGDGWVAFGEGSGFVDDEEFDLREFFERGGVSDEDAESGGTGESACCGDGGGEAEGTGAGGDEDGDGPVDGGGGCFSGEDPSDGGGGGEKKNKGSEDAGDFVSEALEGGWIFFGFVDESGESGDEGVVAGYFGEDEESTSGDESSSEDGVADKLFDGEGFTGENGFLDRGVAFENFSVCGDGFTGEDGELVAGLDCRPGNDFFGAVGEESGGGRGKGEQVFEGAGEFIFRSLFDPLTCEDEGCNGSCCIEEKIYMALMIND